MRILTDGEDEFRRQSQGNTPTIPLARCHERISSQGSGFARVFGGLTLVAAVKIPTVAPHQSEGKTLPIDGGAYAASQTFWGD